MTDTSAPTPARLNVLQLLEVAKNIIWLMSPRVSVGIGDLMLELIRAVDNDEPLLKDRVEIIVLESDSADAGSAPARKKQVCGGAT